MSCTSTPVAFYDTSFIADPPARIVQHPPATLHSLIAANPASCTVCNLLTPTVSNAHPGLLRPRGTHSRMPYPGLIALLPERHDIEAPSIVHSEAHGVNATAFRHPCVILSFSQCGHMVFCLQVTSFRERDIHEKYSQCRPGEFKARMFNEYIALQQSQGTFRHNVLGELAHSGPDMEKQSYIHLEYAFWIEVHNLKHLPGNLIRDFTPQTLDYLTQLWVDAEVYRSVHGSTGEGRLSTSPSPSSSRDRSRQSTPAHRRPGPPSTMSRRSDSSSGPAPTRTPRLLQRPNSWPAATAVSNAGSPPAPELRRDSAYAPVPGPSQSPFVIPRPGNAAVAIVAPGSTEKKEAMEGNWRERRS